MEVVLGPDTRCTAIHAGGDLAFFKTERRDGTAITTSEVLACGDGRFGGLGNAVFTSAQATPLRLRMMSGLLECECNVQFFILFWFFICTGPTLN